MDFKFKLIEMKKILIFFMFLEVGLFAQMSTIEPDKATFTGRVGIGTTNPFGSLHIIRNDAAGTQGTQNALLGFFEREISGSKTSLGIYGYPNNALVTIPYLRSTSMIYAPTSTTNLQLAANNSSGKIRFHIGGWTSEDTEKMRITNNEVRINSNATITDQSTFTVDVSDEDVLTIGNLTSSLDVLKIASLGNAEISIDDNANSSNSTFKVLANNRANTLFSVGELQSQFTGHLIVSNRLKLTQGGTRNNVCVGISAGEALDGGSGSENTLVGLGAGQNIASGSRNVVVGGEAGHGIFTRTDVVIVGHDANSSHSRSIVIGHDAVGTATDRAVIGETTINAIGGYQGWSNFSDGRFKSKVKEDVPGLAFIQRLRPVTYNKKAKELDEFVRSNSTTVKKAVSKDRPKAEIENINHQKDKERAKRLQEATKVKYTGFIAQEVETAAQSLGYEFSGVVTPQNDKDHYSLRYASFVVPLVKAVQEQQEIIEQKEERIINLETNVAELETDVAELKELVQSLITDNNTKNGRVQNAVIESARLGQNMPNPFNENTKISYAIPQSSKNAAIRVHGINGQLIKTISIKTFGEGLIELQTRGLSNGQYTYTLEVDGRIIETKIMNLIK